MILTKGPTLEVELPNAAEMQTGPTRVSKQLSDVERDHIRSVVESSGWRIRGDGGAAEILGLKPTTLEARMKKLGITRTDAK
jgi:transcriptional regulator with GAF, ATPase, and Fis domain